MAEESKSRDESAMSASMVKSWVIVSIRRILAGEDFTYADMDACPTEGRDEFEPKHTFLVRSSDYPVWGAWMALRWWADDEDSRAKYPDYADMRKAQLQDFLELIERRPESP